MGGRGGDVSLTVDCYLIIDTYIFRVLLTPSPGGSEGGGGGAG